MENVFDKWVDEQEVLLIEPKGNSMTLDRASQVLSVNGLKVQLRLSNFNHNHSYEFIPSFNLYNNIYDYCSMHINGSDDNRMSLFLGERGVRKIIAHYRQPPTVDIDITATTQAHILAHSFIKKPVEESKNGK